MLFTNEQVHIYFQKKDGLSLIFGHILNEKFKITIDRVLYNYIFFNMLFFSLISDGTNIQINLDYLETLQTAQFRGKANPTGAFFNNN